jgi:hypothetical protein
MVWPFWSDAYSAGTWRRLGYAVISVPICVVCISLVVVGRTGTAARYQTSLMQGLTGQTAGRVLGRAPTVRTRALRVLAGALAGTAVGLVCWFVVQYLVVHVLMNVGYPLRRYLGAGPGMGVWGLHFVTRSDSAWVGEYHNAWGGPTLAGVWAVHAGLVLVSTVPVLLWTVRGLTRLQGRIIGG